MQAPEFILVFYSINSMARNEVQFAEAFISKIHHKWSYSEGVGNFFSPRCGFPIAVQAFGAIDSSFLRWPFGILAARGCVQGRA